jgi:glycerol-3-phosphate dehydrogenase
VTIRRYAQDDSEVIGCDVIVNAAGPWASRIAGMAGISLALEPSAGVMATVEQRLCHMVINLLAPPGDGDIIVPQRNTSILGTTSWTVEEPDHIPIPQEHAAQLLKMADWLIPGSSQVRVRGVMAAARPLVKDLGAGGRSASRTFLCYDHSKDGAQGLFSVIGGKTTTARHMAEKMSDMVCEKLGINLPCRTRTEQLLSHRLGM